MTARFTSDQTKQINRFTSKLTDYTLARSILGADFISAEEIAAARCLDYTEYQLIELGRKLPDQEALEWCRDNGMILVAGPPSAMTILDMRAIHADFFYSKGEHQNDIGWYDDVNEEFARTDKVEELIWIAFHKEPVKGSLNKTWPDQWTLVVEPMMVLNAAEATWALTTYRAVRDTYLLNDLCVRTSSLANLSLVLGDHRVIVGGFDTQGLRICFCWDGNRADTLGMSFGRKF